MNTAIRCLKALLALSALAGAGLVLRWVTAGSVASANTHDLPSMAFLAIGAVASVAYGWLVLATLATVLEQIPGAIGHTASALVTGITSRGSRALLRSALGVAAVTPLTIGLAHANPTHPESVGATTTSTPNTAPTGSATSAALQPTSGGLIAAQSHPRAHQAGESSTLSWRSIERSSTIRLTNPSAGQAGSAQAAAAQAGFMQVDSGRVGAGLTSPPRAGAARGRDGQGGVGRVGVERVVVPDRPMGGGGERYVEVPGEEGRRAAVRVVRVGESLWGIAEEELGGRASDEVVEARVRQWYAANRHVIGPDPNLIRPGQVLRAPGRQQTPISQEN